MEELEKMYNELKNFAHKFYDHDCAGKGCKKCPFAKVVAMDKDGLKVDLCEIILKVI
jgi:hypothetical protein